MKATTVTFAALAAVSSVMGSALKPRCSPTEVFPEYEDNNKAISYSSGWTFLVNQGSRDAGGVEAYSGEASACVAFLGHSLSELVGLIILLFLDTILSRPLKPAVRSPSTLERSLTEGISTSSSMMTILVAVTHTMQLAHQTVPLL